MALNYTHRPLFPPRASEDNLVAPMNANGYFFQGNHENCWEAYGRSRDIRQGGTESWILNSPWNSVEGFGSTESNAKDIVDLLPADPFGMDIHIKTTVTAITGFLEDLHVHGDCEKYIKSRINGACQDNSGLFFPWNLICNNAFKAQEKVDIATKLFPNYHVNEALLSRCFINRPQSGENLQHVERDFECALDRDRRVFKLRQESDFGCIAGSSNEISSCSAAVQIQIGEVDNDAKLLQETCNVGDIVGSSNEISSCSAAAETQIKKVDGAADFEAEPHEALVFALKYLGLKELLSMGRVCNSLRKKVRGEGNELLWCSIHVDQPLNEKITDDALVQLATRAKGFLQCLSLVECLKITVDGLSRVLENNPQLTKLCVPGCTRLNVEGIVEIVRAHNSRKGVAGIKLVRIGGLNVVKPEQLEDLESILVKTNPQSPRRPHYHRWESVYLPCDDSRPIDVEKCPRCEKIRMVYDCPAEACRAEDGGTKSPSCRACKMCIPRCDRCGTCIDERVFEETFCLDVLCSDCFAPPVSVEE